MALTLITAPSETPVSLAEAKLHARVELTEDDSLITAQLDAARLYCEGFTKRQFVSATYELRLNGFPAWDLTPIVIPRPPFQSITSIAYVDENGASQTWASSKYQSDLNTEPGRVMPVQGESYPNTQADTFNTVTITYVAGYGAASAVPERFKAAIKLLVAHWYENREPVSMTAGANVTNVPLAVSDLLMQDRMWNF